MGATGQAGQPRQGGKPARNEADGTVSTVGLCAAVAMCAVGVYLIPRFALGTALHSSFYHRTAEEQTAEAAVAVVPSGVTVEAVNALGPHLSDRDTVLLWDGDGETPVFAPWVVAATVGRQFTFHSVQEQEQRIALLKRHGYRPSLTAEVSSCCTAPMRPRPGPMRPGRARSAKAGPDAAKAGPKAAKAGPGSAERGG